MAAPRQSRLATLLVSSFLVACARPEVQINEIVMCPGGTLVVVIGKRSFSIRSTEILAREVETAGFKMEIPLIPRHERWFGSFGLYNDGAGDSHTHVMMEEGFQHFSSVEELQYWIASERRHMPLAYTSDGLVVAGRYESRPPGATGGPDSVMSISMWRVLVNGAPPVGLAGAQDKRFKVISLPSPTCSKPQPFTASLPKVINGRQYSGRAIDFMNERGYTPDDVEQVIKTGRRGEEGGRIVFYNSSDTSRLFFVETREDGSVIRIG